MVKYLIIGNGVAGTYAAKTIREADKDSSITIVTKEAYPLYSRPRLPAFLAGDVELKSIFVFGENWYAEKNIQLRLNEEIISIDSAKKEITSKDGSKHNYDKLLIANGSNPSYPPIAGLVCPWSFSLRTVDDVLKIKEYAKEKKNVIAIGGGLLGLEAGNGLRKLGLNVHVVEFFDRLLPRQMDKEGSDIIQKILEKMGFTFTLGAVTEKLYEEKGRKFVKLKDGSEFETDMVLVSAGIKSDTGLVEKTGVKINRGVVIDDNMRTTLDDIYAAGDVAEHNGRVYGLWSASEQQGKAAGKNIAGIETKYSGTVLSAKLKVLGIDMASVGEISPEGAKEYKRVDLDKNIYQKIFVKEGRIAGAVMLGDTKKYFQLQDVIKKNLDISGNEEKILNTDFDLKELTK